jgi:hypothetical protein
MEELVNRIVAHVGLDEDAARKSVGMMLGFLKLDGDTEKVAQLINQMPGAAEAVSEADYKPGFMPGVMGLGSQLMQNGLGMSEITGVAKETIRYGRDKLGADEIDALVASVPGLSQFI